MTNKKRLLALAMAAAMTMSACGTTTTEKPSETPSTPSTPSAGTETPAAPVEEDKYQIKDLVLGRVATRELTTFNILYSQTASDFENLVNMVEGLCDVNPKGQLVPCIATEWGTEDGGITWTFKLRDNSKWVNVNGEELGACDSADFLTGLEWVLNFHKNESSNTSMPMEMIKGATEYYEWTKGLSEEEAFALTAGEGSKFLEMVGIAAPDAHTVVYTCVSEKPYFDTLAGYSCLFPLAQEMVDELGVKGVKEMDNKAMWYNGPYTMVDYINSNEKRFEQNPLYWNTEASRFDSVTVRMIDSADTGFTLFQNGEIDYIDLTESNLKTIYENADHEFHDNLVELRPTKYSYQYHWNYNKYNEDGTVDTNYNTAIANEAFRKSIYWGFDQTAWMQRTNSINPLKCENNAYTMKGLIYDSEGKDYIDLVNEKLETPLGAYNGESMVRYDAEKGAALKAQAIEELTALGVEFPIHIAYYIQGSNQTSLDSATVLKNSLEASLGADYICLDIKTYVSSFSKEVRNSKLHSLVVNGWGADYGDPMNYLGQEIINYDNAFYATTYANINDIVEAGNLPGTEELIADYTTFTEMVWEANAINDDLDARYNAFAEAEAFAIDNGIFIPAYYSISWCLTKINPYSKMNAMYGALNEKMINWETQSEPYTTEQIEAIAAEANA